MKVRLLAEGREVDYELHDDFTLRRFLRARGGDLDKAYDMFTASLQWRKEHGVDTIRETAPRDNKNFALLVKYWPGTPLMRRRCVLLKQPKLMTITFSPPPQVACTKPTRPEFLCTMNASVPWTSSASSSQYSHTATQHLALTLSASLFLHLFNNHHCANRGLVSSVPAEDITSFHIHQQEEARALYQ